MVAGVELQTNLEWWLGLYSRLTWNADSVEDRLRARLTLPIKYKDIKYVINFSRMIIRVGSHKIK